MEKHSVPINDMYNYVISFMDMDKPAGHGVDPFFFDRKPIHEPIHQTIIQQLGLDAASDDWSEFSDCWFFGELCT